MAKLWDHETEKKSILETKYLNKPIPSDTALIIGHAMILHHVTARTGAAESQDDFCHHDECCGDDPYTEDMDVEEEPDIDIEMKFTNNTNCCLIFTVMPRSTTPRR